MRIALVEDNDALAQAVAWRLEDAGHAVDRLTRGDAAAEHLAAEGADLVILDLNLPGMGGLDVLRRLRAAGDAVPVILLTARGDTADRVAGLDAGADDYLVKPFEMAELEARVRALARRRAVAPRRGIALGPLTLDLEARTVDGPDGALDVPRRELALLEALAEARDRLVPKEALLDRIYGVGADVDVRAIEVLASRLRKRLSPYGLSIRAVRGLGYGLVQG